MAIIDLLNRIKCKQLRECHPIIEENVKLAGSYLLGLAVQAMADHHLDEREHKHFIEMAAELRIPEAEAESILAMATHPTEEAIQQIPDRLGASKYKYYFIVDLQIMALQDRHVRDVERKVIEEFGRLLHVRPPDVDFLVSLANAVVTKDRVARDRWLVEYHDQVRIQSKLGPEQFLHYTDDSNFAPEKG